MKSAPDISRGLSCMQKRTAGFSRPGGKNPPLLRIPSSFYFKMGVLARLFFTKAVTHFSQSERVMA